MNLGLDGDACACAPPTAACGGTCVDQASDNQNCGVCEHACTGIDNCIGGACECAPPPSGCVNCPNPKVCGAACVDASSDSANCGDCGVDCHGGTCKTGMCFCDSGLNDDLDRDGFTPSQGDCNDCDPGTNPDAIEVLTPVGGQPKDEDCDGKVDNVGG